jgi:hypothetical protein
MRYPIEEYVFRLDDEDWTIGYEDRIIRLRDSVGLRYLAALVRQPGEAVEPGQLRATVRRQRPIRRGRRRTTPGGTEQDRVAVTKGIRAALAQIAAAHPALGAHLEATIRCGYLCRYVPDPRRPIRWIG